MYIYRDLEVEIQPFLNRREVITIVGARQTGKTTFLKHIQEKISQKKKVAFLTFEKKSDLSLFEEDPESFKKLYKHYDVIIIDEFQYAKKGAKTLKYLYDTTPAKYIISGSSALDIKYQTGKYLVGRMLTFHLWPLSFREYLSYKDDGLYALLSGSVHRTEEIFGAASLSFPGAEANKRIMHFFEEYLRFGGYPAAATAERGNLKRKILEGILENYLLKDIRSLLHLATEDELLKLCKLLANQIGGMVLYKELSNAANLNYANLLKHLEILKKTYIIDLVRPFYKNKRTEVVKNPKVYFVDSGLRNLIIADFRDIDEREDAGRLVENYVFMALKNASPPFSPPRFWRSKSKAEVDFVIENEWGVVPVDVKYSFHQSVGKSMHSFIEKYNPRKALVLTRNFSGEERIKNTGVSFIPAYYA